MKNILVIRLSAIGDIVLTTPVLQQLKKKFPAARIHFLVKEQYADFIRACPHQDNVVPWRSGEGLFAIKSRLRAEAPTFDLLLDLQSNLKSRILASLLRAKLRRRYHKPYFKRLLLVYCKINRYRQKKKVSERYLEALAGIIDTRLETGIELQRERLPREVVKFIASQTVLIAPGARWGNKRWPQEYFVSLASKILEKHSSSRIVWVGGRPEQELFHFFAEHPYLKRHHKRMLFLSGALSVGQLVELANKVSAIITNDSGLMHVLCAAETPLIALFLSTVEEFGFFPVSKIAQVMMARDIPCRPCNHKGLPECPKKHFRCGRELTADQVYAQLAEIAQFS